MWLSCLMGNESMRDRLRGQDTLFGGWSVIPDPLSAGAMAAAGLDYVVIDLQHGGATERDLPALTGAITGQAPRQWRGSGMRIRPTSAGRSTSAAPG